MRSEMFKRHYKGQEALEFVLLSILVFFSALFAVVVFGNKMASFFQNDSAVAKTASNKAAVILANNPVKYAPDYETKATNTSNSYTPKDIDLTKYNITDNPDGSVSFVVNNQLINIPQSALDLTNKAMQTTGASGKEDLIREMAYMIEKMAAEYPNGDVPIEIMYGTGDRRSVDAAFNGIAEVNTYAIKSGNNVVIIQKDQNCSYAVESVPQGACCPTHNKATGVYRLEGTLTGNQFVANVTSETPSGVTGSYSATLDQSAGGLSFSNSTFKADPISDYGTYSTNFRWDINFDNTANQFSI